MFCPWHLTYVRTYESFVYSILQCELCLYRSHYEPTMHLALRPNLFIGDWLCVCVWSLSWLIYRLPNQNSLTIRLSFDFAHSSFEYIMFTNVLNVKNEQFIAINSILRCSGVNISFFVLMFILGASEHTNNLSAKLCALFLSLCISFSFSFSQFVAESSDLYFSQQLAMLFNK